MEGAGANLDAKTLRALVALDHADAGDLAERLGVGRDDAERTLACLVEDGLVARDDEGAYRLPPLDEAQLRELYVSTILLEGLAVRVSPPFDEAALAKLRAVNDRLRGSEGDAAVDADDEFHRLLVMRCGKPELLRTHASVKAALVRYEQVFFVGSPERIGRSCEQHEEIIAALERGDHERAAIGVRRNFEASLRELHALGLLRVD